MEVCRGADVGKLHLGIVGRCKLSVDRSKDVRYDKSVCSCALTFPTQAAFGSANSIEPDDILDGAVVTHACKVHHLCLVTRKLHSTWRTCK
jgi:hypothetical protein